MSYILDALRKAESQRDRQRVPGLHDQPNAVSASPAGSAQALLWGVLAAGVLAVGLAAWQLWPAAQPDAPPTRLAEPAPRPGPMPPAPVAVAVQPSAPPVQAAPRPPMRPPAVAPAPPPAAATAPAPAPAPPPGALAAPAPAPVPAVAQPASAPAPTQAALGDAPPDAPRIAISGGVYSQDAAQRMLVVNGQVFNEGAEVAPGLVLEQIRPNQAVLRWRGQRYALRY